MDINTLRAPAGLACIRAWLALDHHQSQGGVSREDISQVRGHLNRLGAVVAREVSQNGVVRLLPLHYERVDGSPSCLRLNAERQILEWQIADQEFAPLDYLLPSHGETNNGSGSHDDTAASNGLNAETSKYDIQLAEDYLRELLHILWLFELELDNIK